MSGEFDPSSSLFASPGESVDDQGQEVIPVRTPRARYVTGVITGSGVNVKFSDVPLFVRKVILAADVDNIDPFAVGDVGVGSGFGLLVGRGMSVVLEDPDKLQFDLQLLEAAGTTDDLLSWFAFL